MDSYNKLFMIIRKTDLLNYDEKEELLLYLMNLKDQVKSQKEVIDKAIKYIKSYKTDYSPYELSDYNIRQILDLNIYIFDLIDYDHDKFLEFYKLGDSNVKD